MIVLQASSQAINGAPNSHRIGGTFSLLTPQLLYNLLSYMDEKYRIRKLRTMRLHSSHRRPLKPFNKPTNTKIRPATQLQRGHEKWPTRSAIGRRSCLGRYILASLIRKPLHSSPSAKIHPASQLKLNLASHTIIPIKSCIHLTPIQILSSIKSSSINGKRTLSNINQQ